MAGFGDDNLPYVTLTYTNGHGYNMTFEVDTSKTDPEVSRVDLTGVDLKKWDWARPVGIPRKSETHGGDDVPIYAIGPMAWLLGGVHEQNYIAHALAYASCVGDNKDHCNHSNSKIPSNVLIVMIFVFLKICL